MLGLEGGSLSPALLRMVGAVAAMVCFQESSQLLEELAGVQVGAKQVQRWAQALGEQVAGYERQSREPDSGLSLPSTLYLGLDGTGVPMRSTEVQGRAGKQPDGSARTREAKLCTVWSAERRDPQGRPRRDPHSVTYTVAIEGAATMDLEIFRNPGFLRFSIVGDPQPVRGRRTTVKPLSANYREGWLPVSTVPQKWHPSSRIT